jgi:hypothetical protein
MTRLRRSRAALRFVGLLATVTLVLLAPLLLDDMAFRTSYLLSPSQDAVTISRPTLIREHPRLTLLKGTLSVPPALSGKARTVEAIAALIKGGGARLALKAPVFQVDLTPDPLDVASDAAPNQISPLLLALDDGTFETLTIRDATVNLKSGGGREYVLNDLNADVTVKRKTAMRIKGHFVHLGETFAFDTTLGTLIGRKGNLRMPVKAQIISSLINATIDGRLEIGNTMVLNAPSAVVQIASVRSVARWLGRPWPTGVGLKHARAEGPLEWSGQKIVFPKGTFQMDGNDANGTLTLTLDDTRPTIAGTIAIDALDVRPYLGTEPPPDASLMGQFRSARDVTLPLLGALDTDIRVSAETITAGPVLAQRAAASLSLHDGQLLIDVASMTLRDGAQANGEISIEGWATAPNYKVRGSVIDTEIGDATQALVGVALMRGRGDVAVDLSASGTSGIDVLSKLNGSVGVTLTNGGTVGCSLKALSAAATAADSGEPCRTSTSVGPLRASASLASGIVSINKFETDVGGEPLRLTGGIDLVTRIMDVTGSAGADTARDLFTVRGRPEAPTFGLRKQ